MQERKQILQMFNKIKNLFHKEEQEIEKTWSLAFLRLYKVLWHNGTPLQDSLIISRFLTVDYNEWDEDKKNMFWEDIQKDEKKYILSLHNRKSEL